MNSNKVIVSGKNATTSVFINCSQSQKEEAERLEYEIKNSHTSSEEEAENNSDDETMYDSDEEEEELKNNYENGLKEQIRVLNNALDKKDEEIKKLDEENTKLLSENEDAKQREKGDQELIDELDYIKKVLKMLLVSNRRDYDEDFDYTSKILLQRVERCIRDKCELQEEIEELKEELKERDKVIGKIQSNMFTLRTTIEARDESIKTICDERSTLYDMIQSLKKELKEVSEEADMAVHNHSVDAKALFKEIALNNKLRDELKEVKKELREEKIFSKDNEDNFFRLLDEHRRLEKVMKNVTI